MITTGSNVSGQQSQVAVQHLGVLTTEQIYSPPTVAGAKLVTTTDGVVLAGSSSPKTGLSFLSGDAMDIVSSAGLVPEVAVATISMNSADSVHNLSSMAVHRAPKAVVPDDDEDEDEDNKNTVSVPIFYIVVQLFCTKLLLRP